MRAIILAAGKGERLGEIGKHIPKCMIKVDGKSLLEHNILHCRRNFILSIFINYNYNLFGNTFIHHLKHGSHLGVSLNYSNENEPLGTSGGVRKIIDEFHHFNENFFVIYGDNYHDKIDFDLLINKSKETDAMAIIEFHKREDVKNSGIAEFDETGRILNFIEKPKENVTNWVNAGVYYLNPKIMDYIPKGYSDFGKDIFPKLIENNIPIYAVFTEATVKAFDTVEDNKKNKSSLFKP